MAHSLSAKKRIRQTEKRNARNRARKGQVKEAVKSFTAALTAGNLDEARTQFKAVTSRLGRIADHGTIHKNAAARRRSRLAKRLNAAAAKTGQA
ncbi:MAG: 30S ribosomal protein S20 [Phycisphaerales bacterium]|nr:30S ribosomal protein S20 [Phycisphaerales bacterium]